MCSLFLREEKGKHLMGLGVLDLEFGGYISCLKARVDGEDREG